jgi:hypothetical protein
VDFETFRARLIEEIGAWEAEHAPSAAGYRYYERWLAALERTLLDEKLVAPSQVEAARAVLQHEWAHDHDHRAAAREPDE